MAAREKPFAYSLLFMLAKCSASFDVFYSESFIWNSYFICSVLESELALSAHILQLKLLFTVYYYLRTPDKQANKLQTLRTFYCSLITLRLVESIAIETKSISSKSFVFDLWYTATDERLVLLEIIGERNVNSDEYSLSKFESICCSSNHHSQSMLTF